MSDTSMLVLTPAYNCREKLWRTMLSVAGQSYDNWRMVVIDDVSDDDTAEAAAGYAERLGVSEKVTVIKREEKHGEVRNTLDIVNNVAEDDEVIVRLDAGDYLIDLDALAIINVFYDQVKPAVLWTAHRWSLTDHNISGPIDASKSVYEQPWKSSHLKTFVASELKGLNEDNFKDEDGNWIMIACDQAVFLPMMERARRANKPLVFLPRVMYHYDIDLQDPNLFNTERSFKQKGSAEFIRARGYIE